MDALIQDALSLLKEDQEVDSAVQMEFDEVKLNEIVSLLHCYDIVRSRKIVILGGYLLIGLAFTKHSDIRTDSGLSLARGILDGDYLIGQFFGWMLKYGELDLVAFLAPLYKKMQISAAMGLSEESCYDEILSHIKQFFDEQYPKGGSDEAA